PHLLITDTIADVNTGVVCYESVPLLIPPSSGGWQHRMEEQEKEPIALHVLVVGFHHKKGMQGDYGKSMLTKKAGGPGGHIFFVRLSTFLLTGGYQIMTPYLHLSHDHCGRRQLLSIYCYRHVDTDINKTQKTGKFGIFKRCIVACSLLYGVNQERKVMVNNLYYSTAHCNIQDFAIYRSHNNLKWRCRQANDLCVLNIAVNNYRSVSVLSQLLPIGNKSWENPATNQVMPLQMMIACILMLLRARIP
ncbi:unnamed protein product, partial [Meganyctiphanes norvegica]